MSNYNAAQTVQAIYPTLQPDRFQKCTRLRGSSMHLDPTLLVCDAQVEAALTTRLWLLYPTTAIENSQLQPAAAMKLATARLQLLI